MFDNFTDSTKELIFNAQNLALENHNTIIEPIHILSSMALSNIENVDLLFRELKLNTNIFNQDLKNALKNLAKVDEIQSKIYFSKSVDFSLFICYTIIVPRDVPTRDTKKSDMVHWVKKDHEKSAKSPLEHFKKFQKGIDNLKRLWYNIIKKRVAT